MTGDAPTGSRPAHLGEHLYAIVSELLAADGLLLTLDYDGTLAPITSHPDAASIPAETQEVVDTLVATDAVTVAVVSGRSLADLRERVDVDAYAGNHGLELYCDGETLVHPAARDASAAIEAACDEVERRLRDVEGVVVERKEVTATVHYRLVEEASRAAVERTVREVAADYDDIRVTAAKAALEFRPTIDWDKGDAVAWLTERCVPADETWLRVYAGDDRTDEDAFAVISEDGIAIGVDPEHSAAASADGDPETDAAYRVADPTAIRRLLSWLATYGVDFLDRGPDGQPHAIRSHSSSD